MADTTWLTQDAYDRLMGELEHLKGPGRAEISARIAQARDEGDLKENGGYHAAREEQGKAEARIRQLEDLLRNASVGETPPDDGVVEPGMVVTALVGGDELTFLLGSREVSGETELDVYSPSSALGKAIDGRHIGEHVTYVTPRGIEVAVEILNAKPYEA